MTGPGSRIRRAVTATADAGRRHRTVFILLLVSAAWFVPAIWWGLPNVTPDVMVRGWGPDETGPLGAVRFRDALLGERNQLSPQYPLGHYFVQALFVLPYRLAMAAADNLGLPAQRPSLPVLMLLHRIPSLLMAAGCVAAAYATARRVTDSAAAGWVAAAALATAGPVVYYARTSNVDVPALFWVALALVVALRSLQDGFTVRRALACGVFAGLGTATKDQSYAIFAALGLALLLAHLSAARKREWPDRWWMPPAAGVAAALVVYVATSGIVLLPRWFGAHVNFILHSGRDVPPEFAVLIGSFGSIPATLAGYLTIAKSVGAQLLAGLGAPIILLSLAGMTYAWRTNRRLFLLLTLPILALLLGVIAPARLVRPRFLLPAELILCIFAGLGVAAFDAARPALRVSVRLVAIAGIAWSGLRALDLTYQMLRDSRYAAGAWLVRAVLPGDTVGFYGARLKLPALPAQAVIEWGPFQYQFKAAPPAGSWPQFIIVAPQQVVEPVHEWILPDSSFAKLMDGSFGYQQVLAVQTRSLWTRPLQVVSFVNPPVRVFAREDVARRLAPTVRIELSPPPRSHR
ncbi:MAG: glycosyltransferase family 39 protein [Gemmatimonadota bacterium]|nr:glycosyltransferase family 39 protein [Gemmatimonadota bacterium]